MSYSYKTTAQQAAEHLRAQIVGKIVLVTGVSPKAIGTETVRVLAPHAKTIIVASRSKQRVDEALEPVRKESPSADIRFVALDLTSGASIRAAAREVLALNLPIHVIINNAATPMFEQLTRTEQGFEAQFGANHLGHFLFTSLVFSALRSAATPEFPARVVNVSSVAATFGPGIRWDDVSFERRPEEYSKYPGYIQSKMANVLFSRELAKRYKSENIISFSLHPGSVFDTNMGSTMPVEDGIAMGLRNPDGTPKEGVSKSIPEGASTQIVAAFEPSIVTSPGSYLNDCVIHDDQLQDSIKDEANATRLWEMSEKLWGEKFAAF